MLVRLDLHKRILKPINQLRRNKEIVLLKPDKGNGVVVLNRSDYIKVFLT